MSPKSSQRTEAAKKAGLQAPSPRISPKNLDQVQHSVEALIDEFMKAVGYEKPMERTDERGWRHFNFNSVVGRAGVVRSDDDMFLCVESPVMQLPSDKDLILPLMRELLELNMILPEEARLGIQGDTVFLGLTTHVSGLEKEDIPRCILSVLKISDDLDDRLIKKYAGTSKKRK